MISYLGYPIEQATDVVISVINGTCADAGYLKKLRFVLYSRSDLEIYQKKLNQINT